MFEDGLKIQNINKKEHIATLEVYTKIYLKLSYNNVDISIKI